MPNDKTMLFLIALAAAGPAAAASMRSQPAGTPISVATAPVSVPLSSGTVTPIDHTRFNLIPGEPGNPNGGPMTPVVAPLISPTTGTVSGVSSPFGVSTSTSPAISTGTVISPRRVTPSRPAGRTNGTGDATGTTGSGLGGAGGTR